MCTLCYVVCYVCVKCVIRLLIASCLLLFRVFCYVLCVVNVMSVFPCSTKNAATNLCFVFFVFRCLLDTCMISRIFIVFPRHILHIWASRHSAICSHAFK